MYGLIGATPTTTDVIYFWCRNRRELLAGHNLVCGAIAGNVRIVMLRIQWHRRIGRRRGADAHLPKSGSAVISMSRDIASATTHPRQPARRKRFGDDPLQTLRRKAEPRQRHQIEQDDPEFIDAHACVVHGVKGLS
jgi:hypothetical protein